MSRRIDQQRPFQFGLATVLLIVTALCVWLALASGLPMLAPFSVAVLGLSLYFVAHRKKDGRLVGIAMILFILGMLLALAAFCSSPRWLRLGWRHHLGATVSYTLQGTCFEKETRP